MAASRSSRSSDRRFTRSSKMPRHAGRAPGRAAASSFSRRRTGSPALTRDVGDAAAHQAAAQHADPLHRARLDRGSATPLSFFRAVWAKKISTSRRETSVTASSPKALASAASPAAIPCVGADADHLERPLRRRVVAAGLLEQLLARLGEEDARGRAGSPPAAASWRRRARRPASRGHGPAAAAGCRRPAPGPAPRATWRRSGAGHDLVDEAERRAPSWP